MYKSGFISIIGRPNVGKSTLLNHILKTKLVITSPTAQTTRNTVQGIYTDEEAQMIFLDTPGIHKPQDGLGSFMNATALGSIAGTDIILLMEAADERIGKGDRFIVERLKSEAECPVYLLLNKSDLLTKDEMLAKLTQWSALYPFKEIIPISALNGDNLDDLMATLKSDLPEGDQIYPEEMITDHPEQFILSEFIREKILYFTHDEIPHDVAIVIQQWEEDDDHIHIMADIVVNRKSQKGILIGKQGAMIKKIKQQARRDMRRFSGKNVDLELYVKVEKDWRNKQTYLKEFGYNSDDYS
ncbi:GTPase Era [Intestinibaculum porci]|jgi:GTP-binding protein Era|uniref:GTPase Era n=1 Tax=Intestinibaculum porci TaxID=2487118 RepID=A0A3G9JXB3_9FIRM|nr:GTPase Era [Intestinibaculum porci]MDD6349304.1 GTPase Era [Intestinibaculum porci]MDD6423692.1 GTPase Era [Intestinibaculum porci]BBH27609.1 GTPase Era [Intestinibaculum porci]HAN58194.1 GTPase Era [Erysipelotrichaceae bacterium]